MRASTITTWLLSLTLAALATATFTPETAVAAECDREYLDAGGLLWDLDAPFAVFDESASDAYDGYGFLTVIVGSDDTLYVATDDQACTYEDGDRETVFPTEPSSGGLEVSRKVYVPATGLRFGRILDIVSNPTAAPITAQLVFSGDYGTDDETEVVATSSGDPVVDVGDAWAVVDESDFEESKIASLWDSAQNAKADAADDFPDGPAPGNEIAVVVYDDVVIGPGETVVYMHIEHTNESRVGALQFARAYGAGSEQFYAGLSAAERAQLRNWPPESDQDQDGLVFSQDNCPEIANTDQTNSDGDGQGNVCDADDDNDGLSDAAEIEFGLNPTSADTDGDGRGDRLDACPRTAGTGADGCPRAAARRPQAISIRVIPRRDLRRPHRFRIRGAVRPPSGLSIAQACTDGRVLVTTKAGSLTISTRGANLRRDCTYRTRVTFRRPQRFRGATRLRFTARFLGNARMTSIKSNTVRARVRSRMP